MIARPVRLIVTAVAAMLLLLTGCAGRESTPATEPSRSATPPTESATESASESASESARESSRQSSSPSASESLSPEPLPGIDVSHHAGPIDFAAVADSGIRFAYLKVSEGSSFVDTRAAEYARDARRAGITVGGYHYFSLCSPGAAQGEHFANILNRTFGTGPQLRPMLDVELDPDCNPTRKQVLDEVREFLAFSTRESRPPVGVYLYPDLEERYRLADDLPRPLWVRRLGDVPPAGRWSVWQRSDSGRVPGIAGNVDLNVMDPVEALATGVS